MAAGDERIDVMDQVQVKNRLTDAAFEVKYNAVDYVWAPEQVRNVPRAYAEHFLKKGTFQWDPTELNPPKRRLVLVGPDAEQGIDVSPLTLADVDACLELIDDSNLPPRYFDRNTGEALERKEYRGVTADPRDFRPGFRRGERAINRSHPDMVAEAHAAVAAAPIVES